MRRASTLAALLLCATLGFAPAPVYKAPAGKKDLLSRMLGKWQDGDPKAQSIVVIGKGTLTTSYPGWKFSYAIRVEDGRDPPALDMTYDLDGKRWQILGIVRLEDDTLALSPGVEGATDRPTSFDPDAPLADGRRPNIWVLKHAR